MKKIEDNPGSERRLRVLLRADSAAADAVRLERIRTTVLARIPEDESPSRFRWFPSLLGAGALAGLLLVLALWNFGTPSREPVSPLEHIGSAAADDVRLTELVHVLNAFTEEEEYGGAAPVESDVLGLDPLAWAGMGEDESTLL